MFLLRCAGGQGFGAAVGEHDVVAAVAQLAALAVAEHLGRGVVAEDGQVIVPDERGALEHGERERGVASQEIAART